MKLCVFGSRSFTDYEALSRAVEATRAYRGGQLTHVVVGGARGADRLAQRWAEEHGIGVVLMPADWEGFGRRAGYLRNRAMAEVADAALGFWDGSSPGTKHMVDICTELGVPCHVIEFRP